MLNKGVEKHTRNISYGSFIYFFRLLFLRVLFFFLVTFFYLTSIMDESKDSTSLVIFYLFLRGIFSELVINEQKKILGLKRTQTDLEKAKS